MKMVLQRFGGFGFRALGLNLGFRGSWDMLRSRMVEGRLFAFSDPGELPEHDRTQPGIPRERSLRLQETDHDTHHHRRASFDQGRRSRESVCVLPRSSKTP